MSAAPTEAAGGTTGPPRPGPKPREGTSKARELAASLVVFLVALPLCMAIAELSGVPPLRGIVTGIVGGIIVGFLAGSPLQVSGPAAGLFVIILEFVERIRKPTSLARLQEALPERRFEAFPSLSEAHEGGFQEAWEHAFALGTEEALIYLGAAVLFAGLVQMAAGAGRLGQWFRAISPSVINGMLAGIGVLILGSQFHVMVDDEPRGANWYKIVTIPLAIKKGLFEGTAKHNYAAGIGILTLACLVLWNRFRPKSLKTIPGALIGVLVASIAAACLGLQNAAEAHLSINFIEVPEEMSSAVTILGQDVGFGRFFELLLDERVIKAGLFIAAVASAESLLCATAVDQLHDGPRTNYDKELFAQGVGNSVCGLLGALPLTGVIVRSSANVDAGGKTRWSAVLHGVWLLALVLAVPWLLRRIPTSSLAAILVYTGYRLVWKPAVVKELWRYGKSEVGIYFVTVLMIVLTDLLTGIGIGFGLAVLKLLATFSHLEVKVEDHADGGKAVHLLGAATFLRLPQLAQELEALDPKGRYHVLLKELDHVDHACLELIANWETQVERAGGEVTLEWEALSKRYGPRKSSRLVAIKDLKPSLSGH